MSTLSELRAYRDMLGERILTARDHKQATSNEKIKLFREWERDLSTCTAEEIRERWDETSALGAICLLKERDLPTLLKDHNPLYFLAERMFFNNVVNDPVRGPKFLHPPQHRDRFCKGIVDYYLDEKNENQGVIILAPRDTFKSTFSHGAVPVWISLRERHLNGRDARVAMIHHKDHMAWKALRQIRMKALKHKWFRETWTEFHAESLKELGAKNAVVWPCANPEGEAREYSIEAAGLTSSLTGGHFDIILFDDIVTEDHIDSSVMRRECASKYESFTYTLDTDCGKRLLTGTRYHNFDQYAVLERAVDEETGKPDYEMICISAGGHPDVEGLEELAFPHRWTLEKIKRRRAAEVRSRGNDELYWLQVQNRPSRTHRVATDPAWIKYIKTKEIPTDTWRCILIDPAWKGTPTQGKGDFASIQVWAFERRGSLVLRYLLDGVHSNLMTSRDGQLAIFRLMRRFACMDVAPEEQSGYSFSTDLENMALHQEPPLPINIIQFASRKAGKDQRIVTFLRAMEAGHVFIAEECNPNLKDAFVSQHNDYEGPDSLLHDDAIDCAAYTSDKNIQDAYMPEFAPSRKVDWKERIFGPAMDRVEPRRTRYCAL